MDGRCSIGIVQQFTTEIFSKSGCTQLVRNLYQSVSGMVSGHLTPLGNLTMRKDFTFKSQLPHNLY